jgi:hypothetical protein
VLVVAGVKLADLLKAIIGYITGAVGGAVDQNVVESDDLTAAQYEDVEFDGVHADVEGFLESGKSVFGRVSAGATVSNNLHSLTIIAKGRSKCCKNRSVLGIITAVIHAGVAQLFRARPCQGRGQGLESLYPHQFSYFVEYTLKGVFCYNLHMKTLLLIIGVALFVLGIQDAIRLLADSNQSSVFSFIPGETSLYIGLDVAIAIGGALIASRASKMKEPSPK